MPSVAAILHLRKSHGKSEDFNFLVLDFRNRLISFFKRHFSKVYFHLECCDVILP